MYKEVLGRWTLKGGIIEKQALIKERVDKEAQVEWALQEGEPFVVVAPLEAEKWSEPVRVAFGRGVYRQIKSVLP
jgi:hypothetical protein